MHRGARRGARRYTGVHGGVRGGVQRFFKEVVGEKNQDFMLIRFLNAGI